MNTSISRLANVLARQKRSLRADLMMAMVLVTGLVSSAASIL